jgi:hypothetical protein
LHAAGDSARVAANVLIPDDFETVTMKASAFEQQQELGTAELY